MRKVPVCDLPRSRSRHKLRVTGTPVEFFAKDVKVPLLRAKDFEWMRRGRDGQDISLIKVVCPLPINGQYNSTTIAAKSQIDGSVGGDDKGSIG